MRIGIDARLWSQTGVGRYIRSLYRYLPLLDSENHYVWFFKKNEFQSLKMPSIKWKKVEVNIHWHSLREQLILPWIFYRENLDLLHFPYFSFPILYPGKFVITIHDLIFDHYKTGKASTLPSWLYFIKKAGYHVVLWTAARRAKFVLTLSQDAKSEIASHYSISQDKIVVTYESGTLEDTRREFKGNQYKRIRNLTPYILYVGNAHPHKNVESLVLAIRELRKSIPKVKLVLVGSDSYFYPRLIEFTKKENLEDLVEVVGVVDNTEIAAWYHFALCFVSASKMEGFGIPPLEAMSMGCPVLVSDIPVFHEICSEAAVYFDPSKPSDIAKKIIETLSDEKLIESLKSRGYQRVKMFSWEKTVAETLQVYNATLRK